MTWRSWSLVTYRRPCDRHSTTCSSRSVLDVGTVGSGRSAHVEQVDDEHQGAAGQAVTAAGRAVRELRRAHQLAPSADLHPGDAVLPALDQAAQRELDRLAAVPG